MRKVKNGKKTCGKERKKECNGNRENITGSKENRNY